MTVVANAPMILQSDWVVEEDRIKFHFFCPAPGGGEASDYFVAFTIAEFEALTNTNQLDTALTTRINLVVRGGTIATKAASLVGKTYVVA